MEKDKIEIVDRYSATGTPYPTKDSCDWCEGMGVSPIYKENLNKVAVDGSVNHRLIVIGQVEADNSACQDDEFIFVRCPWCLGTRKKSPAREEILKKLEEDFPILTKQS